MVGIQSRINPADLPLTDKLIYVNRVAKVVKGGKRLSFSALVVTGDGQGHVGLGLGKANEVPLAINKGNAMARKNLIKVSRAGTTIPHEITVKLGAARVMLKPAAPGTGIIAGGSVRAVLEVAGIKDILTKSLGTANKTNVARATIYALSQLRDPATEIARRKGLPLPEPESELALEPEPEPEPVSDVEEPVIDD
jgi:small subunit ribosomal protein S5